jgi:hypothetical protein
MFAHEPMTAAAASRRPKFAVNQIAASQLPE